MTESFDRRVVSACRHHRPGGRHGDGAARTDLGRRDLGAVCRRRRRRRAARRCGHPADAGRVVHLARIRDRTQQGLRLSGRRLRSRRDRPGCGRRGVAHDWPAGRRRAGKRPSADHGGLHYGWYDRVRRPLLQQTVRYLVGDYLSNDPRVEEEFNRLKNEFGITVDALSWMPPRVRPSLLPNYEAGYFGASNAATRHVALLYEGSLALPRRAVASTFGSKRSPTCWWPISMRWRAPWSRPAIDTRRACSSSAVGR